MPVRQLRRLEAPTAHSFHAILSREALSYAWSARETDPIPADHPELIVERDGNLLAALAGEPSRLAYSYESDAAFVDHFPPMFEQLLPRLRKARAAGTARFRLALGSSRSAVEPVLRKLSFTPQEPWLTFSLAKRDATATIAAKGVTFRPGTAADVETVVRIDRDAFPDTPLPASVYRQRMASGGELMIAMVGADAAGFALYSYDGIDEGYLSVLAVAEPFRGRGIGPALTMRVAKWAFARGADHLALRAEERNSLGIKVYRRLGFKHTGSGTDYERPTDPRVIAAMKKAGEGTLIRFGGWR